MDELHAIPGHPLYSICRLSRVRSERSGSFLSHDSLGRVSLKSGQKRPRFFVGELLRLAGLACQAAPPAQTDMAERLDKARRLNGHYQALVDKLRAEIEALKRQPAPSGRKRGRKPRPHTLGPGQDAVPDVRDAKAGQVSTRMKCLTLNKNSLTLPHQHYLVYYKNLSLK